MAKYFKEDSETHKKFNALFTKMEELGIYQDCLSNNVRFYVPFKTSNGTEEKEVLIVDTETDEEIQVFPPVLDFRVKLFNS